MATCVIFSVLLGLMAIGEHAVHMLLRMVEVDVAMYCISTDTTLTSANLHSVLASLNDEELCDVLGGFYASRKQMITNWMMTHFTPTWEWLAGKCFYFGKEKALEEVKKHFKSKLGMLLIQGPH